MEKYGGKYRIPSARHSGWDYAASGDYFITICTAHRQCLFGQILPQTAAMVVSPVGEIVQEEWLKSFQIRTELCCEVFVIMPNHLHAIVRIDSDAPVETHGRASLQTQTQTQTQPKQGIAYRPPKSISSFVAGFKSATTKRINEHRDGPPIPVWQSRFHDPIIRNAQEYQRIKDYIVTNPQRWICDTFYEPDPL